MTRLVEREPSVQVRPEALCCISFPLARIPITPSAVVSNKAITKGHLIYVYIIKKLMRLNISHIVFVLFSIEYMSTRIDFSINSIPFGGIIVVNELGKVLIWFVYDPLDYQTIHVA